MVQVKVGNTDTQARSIYHNSQIKLSYCFDRLKTKKRLTLFIQPRGSKEINFSKKQQLNSSSRTSSGTHNAFFRQPLDVWVPHHNAGRFLFRGTKCWQKRKVNFAISEFSKCWFGFKTISKMKHTFQHQSNTSSKRMKSLLMSLFLEFYESMKLK